MEERNGRFPDWKKIYENQAVETMPWFKPELDEDLDAALKKLKINSGAFLDVGTGPATQAVQLAKRGFKVTGSDLSPAAIKRARSLGVEADFIEDDILDSKLKGPFDYLFDRGCFHVLPPDKRSRYAATIHKLLKHGGYAFIKGFSDKEPDEGFGPYRLSLAEVRNVFSQDFDVLSIADSEFSGHPGTEPKAFFAILRNK